MINSDLKAWRLRLGLSQAAAAKAVGVSASAYKQYEAGHRFDTGSPVAVPPAVAESCQALEAAAGSTTAPRLPDAAAYTNAALKGLGLTGKEAAAILLTTEQSISRSLTQSTGVNGGLALLMYLWPRLTDGDRAALLRLDHARSLGLTATAGDVQS